MEIIERIIQSLGLLFRAKILKNISNQIKLKFNRNIPNNFTDLKSIKGIGDYNANAILCFGFGEKRPLIDSNFIRIYSRVFNIKSKTKTPKTDKYLWNISTMLLPGKNYINFNYAIIDLGGSICISRNPKCDFCPLIKICFFYKKNREGVGM